MNLNKARAKRSFYGIMHDIFRYGGPIAIVGFRFDLFRRLDTISFTFVGFLIIVPIIGLIIRRRRKLNKELPIGTARTLLFAIRENSFLLIIQGMMIGFNSATFKSFMDTWYWIIFMMLVTGIIASMFERMREYWVQYIDDRRQYERFENIKEELDVKEI